MKIFSKPMTYRQYLKYLMPSVLTMVALSFYTTIDGFFVSRFAGSDALAAINIVIPVTCIIFGTSVMLATGAGAIIGELMGRGENQKANQIFSMVSLVLVILSVLFGVTGVIFLKPWARMLGTSERLMPHVLPYLFVVFAGSILMSFKLFFEYMVRTDGHPKVGLHMSLWGLGLNVVFDWFFVAVVGWGTFGASLGTILSIGVSASIGLHHFLSRKSTIRFTRPKWDGMVLWKSCSNGVSEMLTELSTGITTFLFNIIIMKYFGEDGVAAVTIIMYIYYFFIAFYMGISVASSPIVSYNIGADNRAKIRETVRHAFMTIILSAFAIMMTLHFFGDWIIRLFTDSANVFELTSSALKLFNPLFLFIGWNVFMSGYFTAVGDGLTSAIISSLRSFVLVVVFIFALPPLVGLDGIWMTMPASELVTLFLSIFFFLHKGVSYFKEEPRANRKALSKVKIPGELAN